MGSNEFLGLCIAEVLKYARKNLDVTNGVKISTDDVYVVWSCKTLENNKALLSTSLPDGLYYECTYNGAKKELYIDVYKKWENIVTG